MKIYTLERQNEQKFLLKPVVDERTESVRQMLSRNGHLSADGVR